MAKSSIKDLINLDYDTLVTLQKKENRGNLESIVRQMITTANRRINKLTSEPVGEYSPALMHLKDRTGMTKFTTKGLKTADHNKLLHLYTELKRFMKAESSTLRGWRKIRSDIAKRTGASKLFGGSYKSERSAKIWHNRELRFWKLYNELKDNYGGILTQLDSDRIQQMLSKIQTMKNKAKSNEDISMAMTVYIEELYRKGDDWNTKDRESYEDEYIAKLRTDEGMEEIRLAYEDIVGRGE